MNTFRAMDGALVGVATLRILVAAARFLLGLASGTSFTPAPVLLLHLLVPGGAGAALLIFGRRDPRARPLGVLLILSASAFSDVAMGGAHGNVVGLLLGLQPAAFIPFYAWTFLHRFPVRTPFGFPLTWDRALRALCLAIGAALFISELLRWVTLDLAWAPALGETLHRLGRSGEGSLFWSTIWLLVLPAIPYGIWKLRLGNRGDRRRTRVLLAGVLAGLAPSVLFLGAWSASDVARGWLARPSVVPYWTAMVHIGVLSIPLTVYWVVVTRRALDVRLVIRQAAWYILARQSAVVLVAAPGFALAALLYVNREERIGALVTAGPGATLIALTLAGVLLFARRRSIFDAVDRRFFREQYQARAILGGVAERVAEAPNLTSVVEVLKEELERALHPRVIEVFLPQSGVRLIPVGQGFQTLVLTGGVSTRLAAAAGPVPVEHTEMRGDASGYQQDWPANNGFTHMVPLRDGQGQLQAVLALGEKRSELPFTAEDLGMLARLATVVGLRLRQLRHEEVPLEGADGRGEPNARECRGCGLITASGQSCCPDCGDETMEAPLPLVLFGKVHLVRRAGRGGMGVVYRGQDTTLERAVAVKTLVGGTAADITRLRREARTMASVSHPNLAVIFGAESWRTLPVLLVEYLEGGTLRDRLSLQGPLPATEALDLVRTLASAVRALHSVGILHRDIKPSNVGFTRDGVPKLLDFGLARYGAGIAREVLEASTGDPDRLDAALTRTGALVGTLPYLAPEALGTGKPEPVLDVWALCVLLFESLSGRSPFQERTPALTLVRIRKGIPPDGSLLPEDLDPRIRSFAVAALTPSGPRPRTVRQLQSALDALVSPLV